MRGSKRFLGCVISLSFLACLFPTIALGVVGDTYTKTTTITNGATYLLAGDIYALDRSSFSLQTNQGSQALTALSNTNHTNLMAEFGSRDFTVSGNMLTQTSAAFSDDSIDAYYRFTINPSGTSDGANPGYYIQRSGSYLDLYQTWTGLTYPITGETYQIGTSGQYVTTAATVTDPITRLSSTPRVWFWNGSSFYTNYTSDKTSIGQLIPEGNGFWSNSYLLSTESGWSWINWDFMNDRSYTNYKFYLTGGYTSKGQVYAFYDETYHPEITYEKLFGYRGSALFANDTAEAYSYMDTSGLGFQISPLSLYKLNVPYSGAAVNITVDGVSSNQKAGSTVALYQSGTSKYSGTIASGASSFTFPSAVMEGVYDVRIDGRDTNVDLTVSANNASATVNFYSLAVSGGTGSGIYLSGQTVSISATVPSGKVFSQWTSTTAGLSFASSTNSSTTLTMPTAAASVTAQFVDATYTITAAKQSGATSVTYGYADSSGDIVARVTNTGNSPITGLSANITNLTGATFSVSAASVPTTLAVGATTDITIDFSPANTVGTYTGTLQVSGDNGASASYSLSQTVTKRTISLSLSANPTSCNAFDSLELTATVTGAIGETPRGTVTFKMGTDTISTDCVISADAGVITAKTTVSSIGGGTHGFSAEYVEAAADNYTTTSAATLNGYIVQPINQTGFGFTAGSSIDKTFNDAPFDVVATGGQSSGAISYAVTDGNAVVSVNATSGEVTILAAGIATITATRAGDSDYNVATTTITINVAKCANTLEVTRDDIQYGQILTSGLHITNPSGGTLSYLYEGTESTVYSSTTAPSQVGTYKLTVWSAATDNYLAATDETTFSIDKATPILVLNLNPITIHGGGTVSGTLSAVNPFDASLVAGLPTAAQISCSDSLAALEAFSVDGSDGSYAVELELKNISALTTITASFEGNESYLAEDSTALMTITFNASVAGNRIVGIAPGADFKQGIIKRFDAYGSGISLGSAIEADTASLSLMFSNLMTLQSSLEGDTRYIPKTWSVGSLSGSWDYPESYLDTFSVSGSPFNATFNTSSLPLGANTLTVSFELQTFNGENWISTGETDQKSVTFTLSSVKTSSDNQSDNSSSIPNAGDNLTWIWFLLGTVCLSAISFLRAQRLRKKTP